MAQSGLERVTRFGLRCLAVAGFASAAWLLSSSAAHAADEAAPAEKNGLSVINLVSRLGESLLGERGTVTSLVTETLGVPAQALPCDESTVDTLASESPSVAPECGATTQPAGSATGARIAGGGDATRSAPRTSTGGELVMILRGLTAPLGLSEVASASAGLINPLTRALNPLIDPLTPVLRPITTTLNRATSATTSLRPATRKASARSTAIKRVVADPTASIVRPVGQVAGSARSIAARGSVALRPGTELRAGTPGGTGGSGGAPERRTPRPIPAHHGAGTGFVTTGPGSVFDGGSFAVVPSSVMAGSNASSRSPVAAHVTVLRLDAEDRTFSPD